MPDRDWADSPFVRVYLSTIDDPKFVKVFDDDRAFAAWVRLLMIAEPAWPARPPLPAGLGTYARRVLERAGLLIVDRGRYTLSGLKKEREGRAKTSTERSRDFRDKQRNATALVVPDATGSAVSSATVGETAMQPSRAGALAGSAGMAGSVPPAGAREGDDLDGPLAYFEVTGKYPTHQSTVHDWTTRLAEAHSPAEFQKALATEYTISRNLKDILGRTEARLARLQDQAAGERTAAAAKSRATATLNALEAEKARRERLLAEPAKPLSELLPRNVAFGGKS